MTSDTTTATDITQPPTIGQSTSVQTSTKATSKKIRRKVVTKVNPPIPRCTIMERIIFIFSGCYLYLHYFNNYERNSLYGKGDYLSAQKGNINNNSLSLGNSFRVVRLYRKRKDAGIPICAAPGEDIAGEEPTKKENTIHIIIGEEDPAKKPISMSEKPLPESFSKEDRYSGYFCSGGTREGRLADPSNPYIVRPDQGELWHQNPRRCVFQNVCYDLRKGKEKWIYYSKKNNDNDRRTNGIRRDSMVLEDPIYGTLRKFRHRVKEGDEFNGDFVRITPRLGDKKLEREWTWRDKIGRKPVQTKGSVADDINFPFTWAPERENGAAPRATSNGESKTSNGEGGEIKARWINGISHLMNPFDPHNVAHFLWEAAFNYYQLLKEFEPVLENQNSKASAAAAPKVHTATVDESSDNILNKDGHAATNSELKSSSASTSSADSSENETCRFVFRADVCEGRKRCKFFENMFMKPIVNGRFSHNDHKHTEEVKKTICGGIHSLLKLFEESSKNGNTHVCFTNLLVGAFDVFDRSQYNMNRSPLLWDYRQFLHGYYGVSELDPKRLAERNQVTMVVKTVPSQRRIVNVEEIGEYIQDKIIERKKINLVASNTENQMVSMSSAKSNTLSPHESDPPSYPVCLTNWMKSRLGGKMTAREQLQVLANTLILVTPNGGTAMIMPFLPINSYVLMPTYVHQHFGWVQFLRPEEKTGSALMDTSGLKQLSHTSASSSSSTSSLNTNFSDKSTTAPSKSYISTLGSSILTSIQSYLYNFFQRNIPRRHSGNQCPACPWIMDEEFYQEIWWVKKLWCVSSQKGFPYGTAVSLGGPGGVPDPGNTGIINQNTGGISGNKVGVVPYGEGTDEIIDAWSGSYMIGKSEKWSIRDVPVILEPERVWELVRGALDETPGT